MVFQTLYLAVGKQFKTFCSAAKLKFSCVFSMIDNNQFFYLSRSKSGFQFLQKFFPAGDGFAILTPQSCCCTKKEGTTFF